MDIEYLVDGVRGGPLAKDYEVVGSEGYFPYHPADVGDNVPPPRDVHEATFGNVKITPVLVELEDGTQQIQQGSANKTLVFIMRAGQD